MIAYMSDSKNSIRELLHLKNIFSNVAGYSISKTKKKMNSLPTYKINKYICLYKHAQR